VWRRAPTTQARIRRPAEMVMLAEIASGRERNWLGLWFGGGTLETGTLAEAPVCANDGPLCLLGWVQYGWPEFLMWIEPKASIGEEGGLYTGGVAFRKATFGNFAFADGHVAFLTATQAARGTNWHAGIDIDELKITDPEKYLWLP
jgi:prepilin-type processing-associated H-X9-DG protein